MKLSMSMAALGVLALTGGAQAQTGQAVDCSLTQNVRLAACQNQPGTITGSGTPAPRTNTNPATGTAGTTGTTGSTTPPKGDTNGAGPSGPGGGG